MAKRTVNEPRPEEAEDLATLKKALSAITTASSMSAAIAAIFEVADFAEALATDTGNGKDLYSAFSAVEVCLEKIQTESDASWDKLRSMITRREKEASHG